MQQFILMTLPPLNWRVKAVRQPLKVKIQTEPTRYIMSYRQVNIRL